MTGLCDAQAGLKVQGKAVAPRKQIPLPEDQDGNIGPSLLTIWLQPMLLMAAPWRAGGQREARPQGHFMLFRLWDVEADGEGGRVDLAVWLEVILFRCPTGSPAANRYSAFFPHPRTSFAPGWCWSPAGHKETMGSSWRGAGVLEPASSSNIYF